MNSASPEPEYSLCLAGERNKGKERKERYSIESDETETNNPNSDTRQQAKWSDAVEIGTPVIWGDQITNTIKKLKSLTFFAIGTAPAPLANQSQNNQSLEGQGGEGGKKKRGRGRKGKKNKNSTNLEQGEGTEAMVQEDNGGIGIDLIEEVNSSAEFLPCGDVANFECVETDIKLEGGGGGGDGGSGTEKKFKRKNGSSSGNSSTDKPNHTYTDIITRALEENPQGLTVSEIYDYISRQYSYFHPQDDRWKNSVRHNLSISPYFHKGEKSKYGAGHVWTIAENCRDIRPIRRRTGSQMPALESCQMDLSKLKTETDYAVASILTDYNRACNGNEEPINNENESNESTQTSSYDADALTYGTVEEIEVETCTNNNNSTQHYFPLEPIEIEDPNLAELEVSEIEIELESVPYSESMGGETINIAEAETQELTYVPETINFTEAETQELTYVPYNEEDYVTYEYLI